MTYSGRFGVHLSIHQPDWLKYPAPALVDLADRATSAGFATVWVNDSFVARQTVALLGAIAARRPRDLGTLVTYPFARNPIDFAQSLSTIAELNDGHELRIGISTGAPTQQGLFVRQPTPTQMVAETVSLSQRLIRGDEVFLGDYPALSEYYHLKNDVGLRIPVLADAPVSFWVPPHGPRMLELTAKQCEGVLMDTSNQYFSLAAVRDGTLERTLEQMDQVRRESGNTTPLRRILKIGMSLAVDRTDAHNFARNFVSFQVAGHIDRYRELGFPADQLDALESHYRAGGSIADAAQYVSPELINQVVMAGTPSDIAERFAEYVDCAERLGIEEIILAVPFGPNPFETIELAERELLPMVQGG